MQQADDVSSYAREDRPRIHGVRSLMSYSKARPTTFEGVWGCLSENAAMRTGQQVKVHKSADILEVCKITTFCDRKG